MAPTFPAQETKRRGISVQTATQEPAAAAGLSSAEAAKRLQEFGPNTVELERPHPVRALLSKFWAPVPWVLEVTVALQLAAGEHVEAAVIATLLVLNALVSLLQEGRAHNALALLRQKLMVQARVRRDGRWQDLPADGLVPGDVVRIGQGVLVPADLTIIDGAAAIDQSALTGESVAVEAGPGMTVYAGSLVQRGEATATVIATNARTYFGRTAELVRSAKAESRGETAVLSIVRVLITLSVILIAVIVAYARHRGLAVAEIVPLVLTLLLASVPVALPAFFTVTAAFGALSLARQGVLVTRLGAIEEAAGMDVLCSDKTGTLTKNEIDVAALDPAAPFDEAALLRFAALASDAGSADPVERAIVKAAEARFGSLPAAVVLARVPFDPARKRSEVEIDQEGVRTRIVKGAPQAVSTLTAELPADFDARIATLGARGYRVLAVAGDVGRKGLRLIGLLALADGPRADSKDLVTALRNRGVRVLMVTGDQAATARTVAEQVGIQGRVATGAADIEGMGKAAFAATVGAFAGVFPQDKYRLVRILQKAGHVVGMCGDGVNDAPALKQAQFGIAVVTATDVAKAAASAVLTSPGLRNVLAAVDESRRVHSRIRTYTLNAVIKKIEMVFFLSAAFLIFGRPAMTPVAMVLLLFANDLATMAISTDRAEPSPRPETWRPRRLIWTSAAIATMKLGLSLGAVAVGTLVLRLPVTQLHTLAFLTVVLSGQGTVYLLRTRGPLWASRPSPALAVASVTAVSCAVLVALLGVLMAPLPWRLLLSVFAAVAIYLVAVDRVKIALFRHLAV